MPAEVVPRSGAISERLTATKLPGQGAELSLAFILFAQAPKQSQSIQEQQNEELKPYSGIPGYVPGQCLTKPLIN